MNKKHIDKITNEDLRRLIICAINTKFTCNTPAEYERSWLEALNSRTLEIEGYERNEWTRFDANDPKTFPKLYPVLILLNYGGIDICSYFYEGKFQTGVVDSYGPDKITHWRPLPKPPVESEEQQ